jgi:putative spermidine/putrescine transport system ATP-binding protein
VVALRPEKISIVDGEVRADNVLKGVISEWNYLGAQFRLVVDTLEFGAVTVAIPTWKSGAPPAAGQPVSIGWDASAGTLVSDN